MPDLAETAMAWLDPWWDEERGLLWNPVGSFEDYGIAPRAAHMVPQSGWYAVGLLGRGDTVRAMRVFEGLCDLQYDEPGVPWHGTFARFAESRRPVAGAVEWVDYDPNWRQFVATTFAFALANGGVPDAVAGRMRAAIDLAMAGEPARRVSPRYSNIALMKAWLEVEAGAGEEFAEAVVEAFRAHGAFEEYNSPTYYGIDLFALALWRRSSSTALRAWGSEMEAALWTDVARWYHAGLRNLCGPYSRSYGLDMRRHMALLGLWIWRAIGADAAPVPELGGAFDHSHDLTMAPVVDAVAGDVPRAVREALSRFAGERLVRQQITEHRVATGWLAEDVMFGAEAGGRYRAEGQYVPVTAHWRLDDGNVGALRLLRHGPVDAVVTEPGRMEVTFEGDPPAIDTSHPFPGVIDARSPGRVTVAWRG